MRVSSARPTLLAGSRDGARGEGSHGRPGGTGGATAARPRLTARRFHAHPGVDDWRVWLHELDPPRPGRGRTHIDISVPADHAEARVAAAVAAGGRIVREEPGRWWTIASPENHGVDIASWPDVEDFDEDPGGGPGEERPATSD